MATKKQSRPVVEGLANPQGVTAVYGTPIDWGSLPEKIRIGRRIANGRFKLEAHYPAKQFNDKKEYIDKRKAGSYCRFYDKKSPFFIARTVWDATSHPGMHMVVKNRNETYRFIVTPKADDPTEATVIGAYLVHRGDGVPVLCSGPIGELKAVGDDGDFKVTAYKKHGIRCPKKDSSGKDLAGEIPKTFGYIKRTSKKGPRKTAKDYCKPSHTFKHPTDIKRAEVVEEMDAYMDEQCTCLMCNWSGAYSDLTFLDDTAAGGPPGMDFMLVCPSCGDGDWLDDMMAEGYDEPCFSCDGIGTWDDGDCEYCHGSGMMSDTLRAEMAIYNSEYFDADCGCFKKAEETLVWKDKTLSFMDWAKQEEASHLKKYGAETFMPPVHKDECTVCVGFADLKDLAPEYGVFLLCDDCITKAKTMSAESKNLSKEDRRKIWMRRKKGSDFHAEDEDPADLYSQWDRVVREDLTLEESGISYEVIDSVGEGADVVVQNGVLLIPRHLYEEVAESLSSGGEAIQSMADTSKPFFWNGMPENEFITKSGEVAEWIMQYEYGPIENWWVWQGDGPEDPDDPDEWGYVDTGAEGLYLGVTMFIRKLNGYPYDEVPIENLDIDDRLNVWEGHSMKGLWTNEPTISEDYDSLIFEAPYAGPGATMDIGKDTALSSFTPEELTTSSAIHGDFDQASLDYSGHQNIEVRAEGWGKTCQVEDRDTDEPCTAPATVNLQDILMEYEVGEDPYEKMHLGEINEFFCKKHYDEMDDMWAETKGSEHQNIEVRAETNTPLTWSAPILTREDYDELDGKMLYMVSSWWNDGDYKRYILQPLAQYLTPVQLQQFQNDMGNEIWPEMEDEFAMKVMEYLDAYVIEDEEDDWDAESFEAETICDECEVNKATHRYNPLGTVLLCGDCLEKAEEDDGWNMIPKDEESLYAESFGAERYGKRQRFGNRYVARNTQGEFISNVGVGASLKADRRNKSKTPTSSGFGNKGDSQKTPPVWAKPLGYVGALAAGWISASMIDNAKE